MIKIKPIPISKEQKQSVLFCISLLERYKKDIPPENQDTIKDVQDYMQGYKDGYEESIAFLQWLLRQNTENKIIIAGL